MRVHKPKVEYKLALQEKPQGSILTYYYKTNNLTRINWLNTRLIIASNKIRHEIPFKTKRVKYTAIWKKSIKTVKESKSCFTYPSPFSILFPSSIFSFSLLHNFIIFPPQCFYSLLHNFYYFPSSMFFIPLLHLHLLIYSIYFSIHKYIDLLATLHQPHIDPTSCPHRPYIDPSSTPHRPYTQLFFLTLLRK